MAKKDPKTGKRMTAENEAQAIEDEAAEESKANNTEMYVAGNARKFLAPVERKTVKESMVSLQFNKSWGAYNADEVAGFTPKKAADLVRSGIARVAGKQKYDPPTEKKAVERKAATRRKAAKSSKAAEKEAKAEASATSRGE